MDLTTTPAPAAVPGRGGAGLPLSPMQEGMLFASLQAPEGSGAYIEQVCATPELPYQTAAFRAAWQAVTARHDALRIRFAWRGLAAAVQHVEGDALPDIAERSCPPEALDTAMSDYLAEDRRRGVNLEHAPLHRVVVFVAAPSAWRFVWTIHHAVIDGRGIATVMRELMQIYAALVEQKAAPSLPEPVDFASRAAALAQWRDEGAHAFWRERLMDVEETCALPLMPPAGDEGTPPETRFVLDAGLTRALEEAAARCGVTVATLTHAAWAMLLYRYTCKSTLVFGVTRACAPEGAHDKAVVGLHINTLPLVAKVNPDLILRDWLHALRGAWLEQKPHANTPVRAVQQASGLSGGQPLFETYTVFERGTLDDLAHAGATQPVPRRFVLHERTPSPLTLAVYHAETLSVHIEYEPGRFEHAAIERLAGHFRNLLSGLPDALDRPLGQWLMMTPDEKRRLLPAPPKVTGLPLVHEAFRARALRRPGNLALRHRDDVLTYAELEENSNRLAHALRGAGAGPGRIVAFCLPRSIDAIVTLLATLKTGAAYLPVEPSLPPERRAFLCSDSKACLLVVNEKTHGETAPVPVFNLEERRDEIARASTAPPLCEAGPESLAYVIYTSGSTGQPKGVEITHGALAAFVDGARQLYRLRGRDRVLQFASLSFDAAAEEIFPTLTRGGGLVLRTDEMIDSATGFIEQCRVWGITVLDLPTAFWHVIVDSLDRIKWPASIRLVIIGGEAADAAKVLQWRKLVDPEVLLANTYGPTETTVAVTIACLEQEKGDGPVPIGVPFPHAAAYVLGPALEPIPEGVPGELCIGGPQLARGYLGREDLTQKAFVTAPWDGRTRLYRTGDRVYRRGDGALVYQGRMDRQVKLRGFRIELGEIEAVLREHPLVTEAAVIVSELHPGVPVLCAYVAATPGAPLQALPTQLKAHCGDRMPPYMTPAHILALEALPMTTSGKVDRKALPAPREEGARHRTRAPRGATETKLLEIWEQVFGHGDIGCEDDFLAMGGHSLLAVQIITRIAGQFGVEVPLAEFYAASTIESVAALVDAAPRRIPEEDFAAPPGGAFPLTPDQQILWVYEKLYPGTPAYHIPVAFRLRGPVRLDHLRAALDTLVARHEPLRSRFYLRDEVPVMEAAPAVEVPWCEEESLGDDEAAIRAWLTLESRRPFDIAQPPLIRCACLKIAEEDHILCLTLHHLVADGWSVGVLAQEWGEAAAAIAESRAPGWKPLAVAYPGYAAWLNRRIAEQGDDVDRYWREHLSPPVPRLEWPARRSPRDIHEPQGAQYPVTLDTATSESIDKAAQELGATPFAMLFAVYALALQRMTGQRDCAVAFSHAGRSRTALEPLVGFFIGTLLLRVQQLGPRRFDELLRHVRDDLVAALDHQFVSYARLREIAGEDPAGAPLMQALFLMQSMELPAPELPGVEASVLQVDLGKALAEMTIELYPSVNGYLGWIEYQTELFDRETAARFARLFETLAGAVAANPFASLDELPGWEDCPEPFPLAPAPGLVLPPPPPRLRIRRGDAVMDADLPPDDVELRLLALFERVLRTSGLGIHANFFDHGGHSLLVILLLDRVEREFGVRLPPVRVYQAPSARGLAQFLRDTPPPQMSRVVHAIQGQGSRVPLFFIGSTDMVPPLLPYLNPDQPIYSLNIFGLLPDEGEVPALTIEGIAAEYIAEMRAVQPEGPYRLAGYCRDTMVALEMAQQLRESGQQVDRLIPIDFFWESKSRYPRLIRHAINLWNFGGVYLEEKVWETTKKFHEAYARLKARLAQRKVERDGQPLSQSNRNAAFIGAYYDAVEAYEITRPFPGHVDAILVTEWGIDRLPEWEDVAEQGVTLRLLKACHHNLWNPPQDQDLAALITASLERGGTP
ncbi:MAG: hypothetical protein RLZZ303_1363 [Candidatus Hydrogenedentota bacterium]